MNINQKTIIHLDGTELVNVVLSIPCWHTLADITSAASEGFVRHGGVPRATDMLPKECKIPYQDHLKQYLSSIGDPNGFVPRPIIAFGTRNSVQNLWLPVYDASKVPRVLFRRDEPIANTIYQGFCVFHNEGKLHFSIERVRFRRADAEWDIDLIDRDREPTKPLSFVITGQPLLFDGQVTPHHFIAAVTYDQRHAWHLEWEDWQHNERDRQIHSLLMRAMMLDVHSSVQSRAASLMRIASEAGLVVEDCYLHSSISTADNNRIIHLIMMNGSFEEIAREHRRLGARHAILLDNGGSVGLAAWGRRIWNDSFSMGHAVPPEPVFIGNNSYFRPRGHAVVLVELKEDMVEAAFRSRPSGDAAWRSPI
jgi:hypothetical protein